MSRNRKYSRAALLAGVALFGVMSAQATLTTVTLQSATAPNVGTPGLTTVTVTGTGFPAGATAGGTTVTLGGACGNATATASSLTTIAGTAKKVAFLIPGTISLGSPSVCGVTVSGTSPAFGSTSASLTVNPAPSLSSISPTSGPQGGNVALQVTGLYTSFNTQSVVTVYHSVTAQSTGVGCNTIAAGAASSVTATTITVPLTICNNAPADSQWNVTVTTGTQALTLHNVFTVNTSAPSSYGVTLSTNTAPINGSGGASLTISGTNFPPSTSTIANNGVTVTMKSVTAGQGPTLILQSSSVSGVVGPSNARNVQVTVPAGLMVPVNTQYTVTISGATQDSPLIPFASTNSSSFTALTEANSNNTDCTLIVPSNPLTAAGLATPYQLVATDPMQGACNESNFNQAAFVIASILDPATGNISVYSPLVIDQGTSPLVTPVTPTLPANAVVALWFGSNTNYATLTGSPLDPSCVTGFGQYSYCNAVNFFAAAHTAITNHLLTIPPLGVSTTDGQVCPTTRSYSVVDQDPSDNVPTTYWLVNGQLAQNTAAVRALYPQGTKLFNPSDEALVAKLIDPAIGCTAWTVPDLTDPGAMQPALPLNELMAEANPDNTNGIALVSLADPFTFNPPYTGSQDATRVTTYRAGVNQPAATAGNDDPVTYCTQMRAVQPAKLTLDEPQLKAVGSPLPTQQNSLFTFLASRLSASYQILNCQSIMPGNPANPVNLFTDANGLIVDATFNP